MAKTTDVRELIVLTQIRGEVLRQDRAEATSRHRRWLQKFAASAFYGFGALTLALGVVLSLLGFTAVGFFILGAGLFTFVPRYILAFLAGVKGDSDE